MQRPPVQIVVRALMIVIAIRTGAITAAVRRATPVRVASLVATSLAKAAAVVRIVAPIAVAVPETADAAKSFAVSLKSFQPPRRSAPVRTRSPFAKLAARASLKSAVMDWGHADAERASGS
jgi:hypothetical protein